MNCWKCEQEMDLLWQNPWRKLKSGDRQMKTVLFCFNCGTMIDFIQTEWGDDWRDLCNDDVPEEIH